jgi:hypothetical protein
MDLVYLPLTTRQRLYLDANGERVWTETEKAVMKRNTTGYDHVREVLPRRCKVAHCGYVLIGTSVKDVYELPEFGEVCQLCYDMHTALQHPKLRNLYYFRRLHDQWLLDNNAALKNRKDKFGL